jgi:hypothetical protein
MLTREGPVQPSPLPTRLRATTGAILAFVVLALPVLAPVPEAHAVAVVRRAPGGAVVRPAPVRPPAYRPVHRPPVVVAPVRPIPAVRPWYWGRVVAGVTIGAIIVASAVAVAPTPPSPELCWSWSDTSKTRGYWNYCTPPSP